MGGGGGFIDYNGDGLLDIYLVCYSQTTQADLQTEAQRCPLQQQRRWTLQMSPIAGISNSMVGWVWLSETSTTTVGRTCTSPATAPASFIKTPAREPSRRYQPAGVNNQAVWYERRFLDYDNDGYLDLFAGATI